jgi:phosphotransferase system enzyme I (PtsI)
MTQLEGVPVSPGFSAGTAVVYECEVGRRLEIPRRDLSAEEIATEHSRLEQAVTYSHDELQDRQGWQECDNARLDVDALLAVHAQMVSEVAAIVRQRVSDQFVDAEHALDAVIQEFVERLGQMENEYFRQREQDVRDVGRRMMRHLTGTLRPADIQLPANSVIVARELLPSEAVELAQLGLAAIVVEHPGRYSHTAILSRSLHIPAVGGIHNATDLIRPGEHLLVDGESGTVTISPTSAEMELFAARKRDCELFAQAAESYEELDCVTTDGVDVALLANVGRSSEIDEVVAHHFDGVGLFRTEFIYLESHCRPTYEDQIAIYRNAAERLGDRPLVIRTFDLGGDKLPPFLAEIPGTIKSHTHLRGLRFSLAEKRLFETQLQAILEVAQERDVRILLPMVIGSDDFSLAAAAINRVMKKAHTERRPLVGAMIETPAALFALDEILEMADFVSIGTNDLMQYMLAADRETTRPSDGFTAVLPAILRAVRQVVSTAAARGRPVCVCGEEAGDIEFACLLVGLGVRELSVSPARGAAIRKAIRKIDYRHAREVANQALGCRRPDEVRQLLTQAFAARRKQSASASAANGIRDLPCTTSGPRMPRNDHPTLLRRTLDAE